MRSFISMLFFSYSLLVDLDFKTDFISLFNIVFKQEIVFWDISQDSSDQKMFLLYRTQSFQYQVGAQQRWWHIWKQCKGFLCNDKGIQFEVEEGKISSHRLCVILYCSFSWFWRHHTLVWKFLYKFYFWCKTSFARVCSGWCGSLYWWNNLESGM